MTTVSPTTLRNARAEVRLIPDGGCIAAYRLVDRPQPFDVLRPLACDTKVPVDPRRSASFPLIPYFSRIKDGRFRFNGQSHRLALNFGDHPHSMHGVAWQSTWRIEEAAQTRARMVFDYTDGDWPFPFLATQTFTLDGASLRQDLSVTNTGPAAMPLGLGVHPFFAHHGGATLAADVSHVWEYDEAALPTQRIVCPEKWDLGTGKDITDLNCDTVFEGWNGRARIAWPDAEVCIAMEADRILDRLVVYTPLGQDFFCVEPVSHMTDAFNRAADGMPAHETGMRILAPGESLSTWVRFVPEV